MWGEIACIYCFSSQCGKEGRMSNDLISRQAVVDAIEQHKTAVLGDREWHEGIAWGYATAHRHFVDVVKQLPSAQPEIIRCKDCKHCEYPESEREWCKKGHLHGNAETWFCADGERKNDAGN